MTNYIFGNGKIARIYTENKSEVIESFLSLYSFDTDREELKDSIKSYLKNKSILTTNDSFELSQVLTDHYGKLFTKEWLSDSDCITFLNFIGEFKYYQNGNNDCIKIPFTAARQFDYFYCNSSCKYHLMGFPGNHSVYVNGIGTVSSHYVNDFFYCSDIEEYFSDYDYYRECYPDEKFTESYHSKRSKKTNRITDSTRYFVGFEIEKEDRDVKESIYISDFINKFPEWRKEEDSSLDEDGYELISPIFPFNSRIISKIIKESERLKDHINAVYSSNCGFHVHISDSRFYDSKKLYRRIENYLPLLYSLYPSRKENDYSGAKIKGDSMERRGCIHLKDYGVEIRIFPALINIQQLEWRLKLVWYMLQNPIDSMDQLRNVFKCLKFKGLMNEIYKDNEIRFLNLIQRTWKNAEQYNFY